MNVDKENRNPRREVILRNGVRMPTIGLGTSHTGGYSHSSVVYALKQCNYRLIDTAKRYGTEEFIKHAIAECGVKREDLFLISKLWPTDYGLDNVKQALKGSLDRLGIEYIDAFLIHYPEVSSTCKNKWQTLSDTWRALELAYDDGLIRAIGVSNYSIDDMQHVEENCSVMPLLNQIEFHPYQYQTELLQFCSDKKIQVQGYCPLGHGNLVSHESVIKIANSVRRTPAQVLIRWSIQHEVPTIPKSTKQERVKENIDIFDFELSDEQIMMLDSFPQGNVKYIELDIQDKIDENLPDGYRLDKNVRDNFFQT